MEKALYSGYSENTICLNSSLQKLPVYHDDWHRCKLTGESPRSERHFPTVQGIQFRARFKLHHPAFVSEKQRPLLEASEAGSCGSRIVSSCTFDRRQEGMGLGA